MAIVYRHIRLDKNEPFYIGIGSKLSRAKETRGRSSAWKAVAENGYEIEILFDDLSYDEAIKKEIEFIELYGRKKYGGMLVNLTAGGEGSIGYEHSEETKQKLKLAQTEEVRLKKSRAKLGSNNPNYKKKWTSEQKDEMSKKLKGKKVSSEIIEKVRNSNIGKKRTELTKEKMKNSWKDNYHKRVNSIKKSWQKRKGIVVKNTEPNYDLFPNSQVFYF